MHLTLSSGSGSSFAVHFADRLHDRAIEAASRYKRAEVDLLGILQEVEQHRVFLKKGHSSLFQYVVSELGLSESVAYNLISVSRKAREVPELRAELQKGTVTLSNARKIVPVLNPQNQAMWLEKARTLSQRRLEKEIVKVRPEIATSERASYVTENRVRLELGLSEKDMLRLRRVQDLMSQARRRPVTLEDVLVTLTEDYLNRHDPLERAKRQKVRNGLSEASPKEAPKKLPTETVNRPVALPKRESIPANVLHLVNLRDQRRCTFIMSGIKSGIKSEKADRRGVDPTINPEGSDAQNDRCNQTRWIEIHHRIPVSEGGGNTLENLTTLCSTHHRWLHHPT